MSAKAADCGFVIRYCKSTDSRDSRLRTDQLDPSFCGQRWRRGFEPAWGGRKKQSSGAGSIPKKGRGLPEKQSSAAAGAPKKRSRPPRKAKKQSQLREKQTRPPHFSLAGLRPADTRHVTDPQTTATACVVSSSNPPPPPCSFTASYCPLATSSFSTH